MLSFDRTMSFLENWNAINREMVAAWTRSADHLRDGPSGIDKAFHGQLSAAETAVERTIRLQRDCLQELKGGEQDERSPWSLPEPLLSAAESALEMRSRLWKVWFQSAAKTDLTGVTLWPSTAGEDAADAMSPAAPEKTAAPAVQNEQADTSEGSSKSPARRTSRASS